VVVFEEAIVQVGVEGLSTLDLVETFGDVTLVLEVFGSDLGNVKINQEGVVTVKLPLFVAFETSGIDEAFRANVLVRDNVLWLSEPIAGGLDIGDRQVTVALSLVNLEEEVLLGDNFVVGSDLKCFLIKLILEVLENELLLDDVVDFVFDFANFGNIR